MNPTIGNYIGNMLMFFRKKSYSSNDNSIERLKLDEAIDWAAKKFGIARPEASCLLEDAIRTGAVQGYGIDNRKLEYLQRTVRHAKFDSNRSTTIGENATSEIPHDVKVDAELNIEKNSMTDGNIIYVNVKIDTESLRQYLENQLPTKSKRQLKREAKRKKPGNPGRDFRLFDSVLVREIADLHKLPKTPELQNRMSDWWQLQYDSRTDPVPSPALLQPRVQMLRGAIEDYDKNPRQSFDSWLKKQLKEAKKRKQITNPQWGLFYVAMVTEMDLTGSGEVRGNLDDIYGIAKSIWEGWIKIKKDKYAEIPSLTTVEDHALKFFHAWKDKAVA